MNSSKFTGLLYLGKITPEDCVDWANTCLKEGKDGPNLRKLAQMNKNSLNKNEVFKLVRFCFADIGFRCHPSEINSLFEQSKEIARKILSNEIEPYEGVHKIADIAGQIDFPFLEELEDWIYLDEGSHPESTEKQWFWYKTNPKKELEVIMREAIKLAENDLEFEIDEV